MIYSEKNLSQKLECTEGRVGTNFVQARAKTFPESNAQRLEVAGTYAMLDGTARIVLS